MGEGSRTVRWSEPAFVDAEGNVGVVGVTQEELGWWDEISVR
jgi:hypothetical protein